MDRTFTYYHDYEFTGDLNQAILALSESPYLTQLSHLDLSNIGSFCRQTLEGQTLHKLVHSLYLQNLTCLQLEGEGSTSVLESIASSDSMKNLSKLRISERKKSRHYNEESIENKSFIAFINSPTMKNIEELTIGMDPLTGESLLVLADSPYVRNLRVLDIQTVNGNSDEFDEGLLALAQSASISNL